jgi:hypothetical protein
MLGFVPIVGYSETLELYRKRTGATVSVGQSAWTSEFAFDTAV